MTPRALVLRLADAEMDRLHCRAHDVVIAKSLGALAGAAMLLLALAHRVSHHA